VTSTVRSIVDCLCSDRLVHQRREGPSPASSSASRSSRFGGESRPERISPTRWPREAGLVEHHPTRSRYVDRCGTAESFVANFISDRYPPLPQLRQCHVKVVAHDRHLVGRNSGPFLARVIRRGVHTEFGRRCLEDQPPPVGIDPPPSEHVTKEHSGGFGVGGVDDGVEPGDRAHSLEPLATGRPKRCKTTRRDPQLQPARSRTCALSLLRSRPSAHQ